MQRNLAIVTGVSRSRGIGAAICRELAKNEIDIIFTYWNAYDELSGLAENKNTVNTIQQELKSNDICVATIELDLTNPLSSDALFNFAKEQFGYSPNILINNAAVSLDDNIESITANNLDLHYKINVRATTLLSSSFVKQFNASYGRIINITTGWKQGQMPNELSYVLTKSTMDTLTYTLASTLAEKNITINAINPGPTDSGWMSEDTKSYLINRFPIGRVGQPTDVAKLVSFLTGPDSGWITGQVIHSEGGFRNEDG
ncbi:SDR family oxidoreductase [Alkalicoccobacillus gibsonii]|uniref:SDR family oxidoreductase n=1 Tax=Alkalicoccobacillus gibsonii TaxID=79881 RepID=UPI0035131A12